MPFAIANGVRTYYEISGKSTGSPLLLIPGNGMDHTTFEEQLPLFGQQFRCICYDMRGVGKSDIPNPGYTIVDMAEDAKQLLDALDLDTAHIAGHSLGGCIGQELAIRHPGRCRSLSLYSTFARPDPYFRRRYELLIKILNANIPDIWAAFTVFTAFGQEYINSHDTAVELEYERRLARWRTSAIDSLKAGLLGHYEALLAHDTSQRLILIQCPTWIAVGSSDAVTPVSLSEELHRHIQGSELSVFAGAPHRLLNFTAGAFTDAAMRFLTITNHDGKDSG